MSVALGVGVDDALAGQSVPPCAAGLLEVALQALAHGEVDHVAHIRLVDAWDWEREVEENERRKQGPQGRSVSVSLHGAMASRSRLQRCTQRPRGGPPPHSPMPNAMVATTTATSPSRQRFCTRVRCLGVMPAW